MHHQLDARGALDLAEYRRRDLRRWIRTERPVEPKVLTFPVSDREPIALYADHLVPGA